MKCPRPSTLIASGKTGLRVQIVLRMSQGEKVITAAMAKAARGRRVIRRAAKVQAMGIAMRSIGTEVSLTPQAKPAKAPAISAGVSAYPHSEALRPEDLFVLAEAQVGLAGEAQQGASVHRIIE